ncbi:hypothetical protein EV644_11569 [Kribbella orskensis]|uniref:Uncharacterized protein n=1 Tax=Kribbella orskensis TaxID=2512216 RepID=A0ABY2BDG0_9ACTN|nr:hypothetical protein EV642_11669 [Kribbella sp. VKM Ac-2500]TCO17049.1 hypothetical protein EV644_11569 [Kribbella orskensis]
MPKKDARGRRHYKTNLFHFLFRYLNSGEGDVPPVTREVLRRAEPNRSNRPWVHVADDLRQAVKAASRSVALVLERRQDRNSVAPGRVGLGL